MNFRLKKPALLTLGFLLIGSILLSCGKRDESRKPGTPPPHFAIFYTCDTVGHIRPCECSTGHAGGISRRMTFLSGQLDVPYLLLDAGNVVAGPRDWELLELEYILQGYQAMGYHAVNVGHTEVSLDADRLRDLGERFDFFVSSNVVDETGETIFPPYRVVDLTENYRVGVLGIAGDSIRGGELGEGVRVLPPGDAIARYLPELEKEVDTIVLLAFADEDRMKEIADRFYEIDTIVGGKVTQPTREPVRANRSVLVYMTDKGKAVGRLDIERADAGEPAIKNDIHMLLDEVPDDPAMEEIVEAFDRELLSTGLKAKRDDEEGLTLLTEARSGNANRYIGAESCRECHAKAVEIWETSAHAHAYETLATPEDRENADCLKCHTTGHGASDGFTNERLTAELAAVSCDACHGRGSHHVQFHQGESVPEKSAKLLTNDCIGCHDQENSPEFEREAYWIKIIHGMD
jgi:hypothetical protein